jgi:hypothetical protein
VTRAAALPVLLAALACGPMVPREAGDAAPAAPPAPQPASADTARGIVDEVGSEPGTSFVLRSRRGSVVHVEGDREMLRSVAGVEVVVRGPRTPAGVIQVRSLAVRASDGITAVDGTLLREGSGWVLVTEDARRLSVPHLPEPLRTRAGARVWLAGPLDRPAAAFGIVASR